MHSPRFAYERDLGRVEAAIDRARLQLPVVHDPELETWSRYSPTGWPSSVVLDDRERIIGTTSGLDHADLLADVVRSSLGLGAAPTPAISNDASATDAPDLRWPSGLALMPGQRLAIADQGNDRIVIVALDEGLRSGHIERSIPIDRPDHLLTIGPNALAISQPHTGRVLQIDTSSGETSVLQRGFIRPRGLTLDADGSIVVADAGADRLVRVSLEGTSGTIAGTGFSGSNDGPADRAELSQPVAVTRTPAGIAFVEAATGSIRILTDKGRVLTTTATPPVEPGLVDGPVHTARLQRPGAIAALDDGTIVIVDTGNNRLRLLSDRRLSTLGVAGLDSPEAIVALADGRVLIADTANHRVVGIDIAGHDVWNLDLDDLSHRAPEPEPSLHLRGHAGGSLVVDYPTPGTGPWTVRAWTEPADLLQQAITVNRSDRTQKLALDLGIRGRGQLHVLATGPNPSDRLAVSHRLEVVEASPAPTTPPRSGAVAEPSSPGVE